MTWQLPPGTYAWPRGWIPKKIARKIPWIYPMLFFGKMGASRLWWWAFAHFMMEAP